MANKKILTLTGSGLLGGNLCNDLKVENEIILGLNNKIIKTLGTRSIKLPFEYSIKLFETIKNKNSDIISSHLLLLYFYIWRLIKFKK